MLELVYLYIQHIAFTRYLFIHRHFENQVKSMNSNGLIVAFMILYLKK